MSVVAGGVGQVAAWQSTRRLFRMQAFHPSVRRDVIALAKQSGPLSDLAESFPGLLFALASGYSSGISRHEALRLLHDGAPLKTVAARLGLPWWLRKLPPQAFAEPLQPLEGTATFHERIANALPATPAEARSWLWIVSTGLNACHEDFAVWASAWSSRQPRALLALIGEDSFRYMAAWAWFSSQPDTEAHALLRRPWSPAMGPRRSLDELTIWRRRTRLASAIGAGIGDTWLGEGSAHGLSFVALRTPAEFVAESVAMDNCLDTFAEQLEQGRSRVFSIRESGRPIADIEIGLNEQGSGLPTILQLRGPRNRRASAAVWQAAYAWLGQQPLRFLTAARARPDDVKVKLAARNLWLPYLERLGAGPRRAFRALLLHEIGVPLGPVRRQRRMR